MGSALSLADVVGEDAQGDPHGWIVESRREVGPQKRLHIAYWYGPYQGWGTTSGPLNGGGSTRKYASLSVAWFPTQAEAIRAVRSVYGSRWRAQGYTPVRLTAELLEPLKS